MPDKLAPRSWAIGLDASQATEPRTKRPQPRSFTLNRLQGPDDADGLLEGARAFWSDAWRERPGRARVLLGNRRNRLTTRLEIGVSSALSQSLPSPSGRGSGLQREIVSVRGDEHGLAW
jgi:hypothetical protein